jgi:tetratricopeptide (TPR) repeat protein
MYSELKKLLMKAESEYTNGNLKKAREYLAKIFSINRDFIPAFALMGNILYKMKNFDECEAFLNRAAFYDSEDFESRGLLGVLNWKKQELEKAKSCFLASLEINPEAYEYYYYLGLIEESLENEPKAQQLFEKAFRTSLGSHLKSMKKIRDQKTVLEIFDWAFFTIEGLAPKSVWDNLSYLLTNRSNVIEEIIIYLNEHTTSEVDFATLSKSLGVKSECIAVFLGYLESYYDIPPELMGKFEKLSTRAQVEYEF